MQLLQFPLLVHNWVVDLLVVAMLCGNSRVRIILLHQFPIGNKIVCFIFLYQILSVYLRIVKSICLMALGRGVYIIYVQLSVFPLVMVLTLLLQDDAIDVVQHAHWYDVWDLWFLLDLDYIDGLAACKYLVNSLKWNTLFLFHQLILKII